MRHFDAVVCGGGIAGSTTAVALARKGLRVLVCEAGLPSAKRLAGELMHPPAVGRLQTLGLHQALVDAGAVPVYGFAAVRSAADPGLVLSYSEIPSGRPAGLALEHGKLTRALLDAATRVPGVTVWSDSRVVGADLQATVPVVKVKRDGELVEVSGSVVVSAEGRKSAIRDDAGIDCTTEPPFRMVGWKIKGGRLPYPGYGHLFIGGRTATLAYQVSTDEVRVMFELDLDEGLDVPEDLTDALPEPFREDVLAAMGKRGRATARFCGTSPHRYANGRMAIVGDAGGCVHPVIASGMSFCVSDATLLADCVTRDFAAGRGVPAALTAYEAARRGPMATRMALAPALVDAFVGQSPEMKLLRHGLFRYWSRDRRGRGASMALLSTKDSRMSVMAREFALVCGHALTGLPAGVLPRDQLGPALSGLVRRSAGYLKTALS